MPERRQKPKKPFSKAPADLPPPNPLVQEAKRLRLKKRFSQNFLVNADILDRIVAAAELSPEETVLEIGPGAGFLTERLLPKAKQVIAVELEREMVAYLAKKFDGRPNLTLESADILKYNLESVAAERFTVLGNLPYAISTPILFRLVGEVAELDFPLRRRLNRIVLMVQKEVAERMTAHPGSRAYGPLAIATQFHFDARMVFDVPPKSFLPPPKVNSAVVVLTPLAAPRIEVRDRDAFQKLVRAGFAQRRKTLWNTLAHAGLGSAERLAELFDAVGLERQVRAEQVSMEGFGRLADAYVGCASQG
jgi:16S rRNA (adenine1518-N6/adenine1519-N6)-dimethyltransferase